MRWDDERSWRDHCVANCENPAKWWMELDGQWIYHGAGARVHHFVVERVDATEVKGFNPKDRMARWFRKRRDPTLLVQVSDGHIGWYYLADVKDFLKRGGVTSKSFRDSGKAVDFDVSPSKGDARSISLEKNGHRKKWTFLAEERDRFMKAYDAARTAEPKRSKGSSP